ncbi:MAG TPA: hypothetical protein PLD88_09520 [Candidatus Berkiella sp.]|nr:hypothetical protein [Candidatus Berkiella sp.]
MFYARTCFILLCLFSIDCHAIRALSNDEIRQEIIKGAIKDYENGACPTEYVMRHESSVSRSESTTQSAQSSSSSSSKSESKAGDAIGFWGGYSSTWTIAGAVGQSSQSQGGSRTESKNTTENPAICTCPCPYSKDIKGKECGNSSVYFQYQDGDPNKIPCYPEDIQDWQITDYRQQYDIPTKDISVPQPGNQ